jgi:hypothetical protein
MLFVRAYPRESQEMVFDAHARVRRGKQGEKRASIWMRKCRRVRDVRRA